MASLPWRSTASLRLPALVPQVNEIIEIDAYEDATLAGRISSSSDVFVSLAPERERRGEDRKACLSPRAGESGMPGRKRSAGGEEPEGCIRSPPASANRRRVGDGGQYVFHRVAVVEPHAAHLLEKLEEMRARFGPAAVRPQSGPAKGTGTDDPSLGLARALQELVQEPFNTETNTEQDIADRGLGSVDPRRSTVFHQLAHDQPGLLTLRAMREYRESLNEAADGAPDNEWSPIFLKYFLQGFIVQYHDRLDDPIYRELRTYAEALMRGKTLEVLDLLTQQFRATIMAVNEQSWSAARWLQLIPDSRVTEASARDAVVAHSSEARDLKHQYLKDRLARKKA